jgi:N-acetylmuramoyl-L-alanine amidase
MKIALIPGHGHRQDSRGRYRWDPGAVSEMGREADIVRALADRVRWLGGSRVFVCDSDRDGPWSYTSRRNEAHESIGDGPGVVCHLHVNAGGGSYLLGLHDPRSSTGQRYAEQWCLRSAAQFDLAPRSVKCVAADRPNWSNAANLIEPSYSATPAGVAAVLLEIGFIDNPDHRDLLIGDSALDRHAAAILAAWSD